MRTQTNRHKRPRALLSTEVYSAISNLARDWTWVALLCRLTIRVCEQGVRYSLCLPCLFVYNTLKESLVFCLEFISGLVWIEMSQSVVFVSPLIRLFGCLLLWTTVIFFPPVCLFVERFYFLHLVKGCFTVLTPLVFVWILIIIRVVFVPGSFQTLDC